MRDSFRINAAPVAAGEALSLEAPNPPNKGIGRAIVPQRPLGIAELRQDPFGEHLAEFDAPLVE